MMPPVVEGEETSYPHQDAETGSLKTRHSMLSQGARRYKWYIGATLVIIVIFSIIIGVTISNNGSNNGPTTSSGMTGTPSTADNGDPLQRKQADLLGRIKSGYAVLGLPPTHIKTFEDAESAQTRALNWVAASDNYDSLGDDQKLHRFALAAFFYSTYAVRNPYVTQQVPWTTAEKWLSEADECEWEGISCGTVNGEKAVTGIDLHEHRISGTIPLDLVLLRDSLKSIVLTNNLIFVEGEGLKVFGYLENLESLIMADNYIVERNGLPESLRQLKKLKKLVLSYNLLQGAIRPNYFANLGKLTHLEIESNYLSGPLPQSLYEMPQLVYLYVRRNDFNFNFPHAMKTANWPNICKFYLRRSFLIMLSFVLQNTNAFIGCLLSLDSLIMARS